jgi:nicotinamide riboside kinase
VGIGRRQRAGGRRGFYISFRTALLQQSNQYLFTDTNVITTYHFSLYYHNSADSKLIELARQAASRYDLVFVCGADIPYDDTCDRSGSTNRNIFQKQLISQLIMRKFPFLSYQVI